ncbi:SDR family NAD(P)-dependent oxidoreductase [Paraburkholderia largidicola]|uniref:SDR family NAD(P)-dependent oxidoreductase n=1 Tax=Paraburkholderia largidicola TaxID=3014751 RepID=A0A7I8C2L9_9BURK|nr:hypothetical protein PPGU16_81500 [Paraburkholderia sp. PGU16]
MELQGKRVLITGGSSGIGLELAKSLIESGARVVVSGRRAELVASAAKDLGAANGRARGGIADVGTPAAREKTVNEALTLLGGLDILINNAGGLRAGRLETVSEVEIESMVAVDLLAPILLTRAALPALRASGDGMVVNVASGIALTGVPFYATYAAVKAGLARRCDAN